MKRLLAYFFLCLILSVHSQEKDAAIERTGKSDYIKSFSEARMRLAIQEAQSNLDTFLNVLQNQPPNTSGFSIRKGFNFGNSPENIEFVWIGDVRLVGENLEGQVNNSPVDATYLKKGQTVRVQKDEVADWMYVENNELRGGYTLVALIHGSPKKEQYERSLTFRIDWDRYDFLKKPTK